jgi:ABC-type glycerol-3-phosphate transport system permease component
LGGTLAPSSFGSGETLAAMQAEAIQAAMPEFVRALVIALVTALVSALLCHAFTAAMGFSLGYLRPKGGKTVIVLLGLCFFLNPAVLIIPYFVGFRELGVLNSLSTLILPYLISPLGALLFIWFFRGARDERDWLLV